MSDHRTDELAAAKAAHLAAPTPRERLNAFRDARADLPAAIVAARAERMTHQEIADEAGLSRDGVRKILARQAATETTTTKDQS